MNDGMNSEEAKKRRTWAAIAVGLICGAVVLTAWAEAVVIIVPTGICVGTFLCLRNPARLPAFGLARGVAVTLIAVAAALAPNPLDRKRASLPTNTITIGRLVELGVAHCYSDEALLSYKIALPSVDPSYRQLIHAVDDQTPLKARVNRCLSGASFLRGAWVGPIIVQQKPPRKLATTP